MTDQGRHAGLDPASIALLAAHNESYAAQTRGAGFRLGGRNDDLFYSF
jgi:hypothetical protein